MSAPWPPPLPPRLRRDGRGGPADASSAAALASLSGPTPESNWLIPGRVLASSFPYRENLPALASAGITLVVNLMEAAELRMLPPYRSELTALRYGTGSAAGRSSPREAAPGEAAAPAAASPGAAAAPGPTPKSLEVGFLHFPIVDGGVGEDGAVAGLVQSIAAALAASESTVVLLHCRGGHGRTGTIAALLLGLIYRLNCVEALDRVQQAHDARQQPRGYPSPETHEQRHQVMRLLPMLLAAPAPVAGPGARGPGGSAGGEEEEREEELLKITGRPSSESGRA